MTMQHTQRDEGSTMGVNIWTAPNVAVRADRAALAADEVPGVVPETDMGIGSVLAEETVQGYGDFARIGLGVPVDADQTKIDLRNVLPRVKMLTFFCQGREVLAPDAASAERRVRWEQRRAIAS